MVLLALRPQCVHGLNISTPHGYTVNVPLLPGHGTKVEDLNLVKWQEWPAKVESELQSLLGSCEKVFLVGFSMGGTTSLNIAARYSQETCGFDFG
jgi:carboxylesterase